MAEDETDIAEAPAPKGKGPILVVAGIAAGLAVGGGAVWLLLSGEEKAPVAESAAVEAPAPAPAGPPVDLLLVQERRFAVPLINGARETLGYMWVDLVFEVDGPTRQSTLAARMPEVRDAFLRDVHARRTTREDRPGALDFGVLQERLAAAVDGVVGADGYLAIRIVNAQRMPQ